MGHQISRFRERVTIKIQQHRLAKYLKRTQLCFNAGRFEKVITWGQKYIAMAERIGNYEQNLMTICLLLVAQACYSKKQYEEAVDYGTKIISHPNWERGVDQHQKMKVYLLLGKSFYSLPEHYEDAASNLKKSLDLAEQNGEKEIQMEVCKLLGKSYFSSNQYDEAIFYAKKYLHFAEETENKEMTKKACWLLRKWCSSLKLYDEALLYGKKCLTIADETGDKVMVMKICLLLAKSYLPLEKYNDAITYSKNCMDIAKEVNDEESEMKACLLIGKSYFLSNLYDDTITYCNTFLGLANNVKEKNTAKKECEILKASLLSGKAYFALERYSDAISSSTKCINLANKNSFEKFEMQAYELRALAHSSTRKFDYFIADIERCLELANRINDSSCKQWTFLRIFIFLEDREEIDSTEIDKLLSKLNSTKDDVEKLITLRKLYLIHKENNEPQKAIDFLENMTQLKLGTINSFIESFCCLKIGRLKEDLKKEERCSYETSLELARKIDCRLVVFECTRSLGLSYFEDGEISSCIKFLKETIRCIDFFTKDFHNEQFIIDIFDKANDCYKILAICQIQEGKKEEALETLEQLHARALKELLISNYIQQANDEQHIQYSEIERLVSSSKYSILFLSEFNDHSSYVFFLEKGKEMYLKENLPDRSRGNEFPRENSVEAIFKELKVGQVVNCEDRSLGASEDESSNVTRSRGKSRKQFRSSKDLKDKNNSNKKDDNDSCDAGSDGNCGRDGHVRDGHGNSDSDGGGDVDGHCDDIHGYVGDVDDHGSGGGGAHAHGERSCLEIWHSKLLDKLSIDQEEIVIIPDGSLYRVPFAALRDPGTGKYLAETKRIRLAPSIATLKLLQESSADYQVMTGTLIIGDPLVGKVMVDGNVSEEIKQLKGARKEAKYIAQILSMDPPLLGEEATKAAVIEKLQQGVSIVHIAAHGSLTKGTIALAPSPDIRATKIPDEEDYMLTMADVQQAQVRAQLVVLSCCHSGRGEIKAEGVVGMCRAFLASGARAVVASLWAIDDDATLVFMKKFYECLKEGKSASTSLHLTMNYMRQHPRYSKPKYWAAFFLMGDDVAINLNGNINI